MRSGRSRRPVEAAALISKSGIGIYDVLPPDDPRFLSVDELEYLLRKGLCGLVLNYPIRTRAKVAKAAVCAALGYPQPLAFQKTRPRFPGQDLDIYVQKANNLQIWNEEISPRRRFGLIRVDRSDTVVAVRVLLGEAIAKFDRTGTLTSKYQASRRDRPHNTASKKVSPADTETFQALLEPQLQVDKRSLRTLTPTAPPVRGAVLSLEALWSRLHTLVGRNIEDPGRDQERNRGIGLQKAVCKVIGLAEYCDKGQFPDIRCQALEVKLQTAPTIDLGLVSPDSCQAADDSVPGLRHCDMRYAVFYGEQLQPSNVHITALVLSTGTDFFGEFRRFGGKVLNRKLQIPLPSDLFGESE